LTGATDSVPVPPYARNVDTEFQDYALFPHMTVAGFIGIPNLIERDGAPITVRPERSRCWPTASRQRPAATSVVTVVIALTLIPVVIAARVAGAGAITRSART
jgi:ABC-type Fe3+/spermidine/putrescine transport system ATPase subunit